MVHSRKLGNTVEDDPRNVVHVNYNLIRFGGPEEAYEKSIELAETEKPTTTTPKVSMCGFGFSVCVT
jgi:hypothetical protein